MGDTPRIIAVIGWLAVFVTLAQVLQQISIYLLPSKLSRYAHIAPNGDRAWALVTGASDGIGRAFAQELAAQGFNVVLHGRNYDKLSVVQAELQRRYPDRSFRVLVADASTVPCINCLSSNQHHQHHQQHQQQRTIGIKDLSEVGSAVDFNAVRAAVDDLHLTVLINNAGGSPINPIFAPLVESSPGRIIRNVSLNALFPLHLIRELLPILSRNGPALILNISSMSDQGFPLLASYSASKQFLMNLTRTVRLEMELDHKMREVEVLGVRVGRVTGVAGYKEKPSLFTPSSQAMARAALSRAGYGHGIVIGYWSHSLQGLGVRFLPSWIEGKVIKDVMRKERASELTIKSESKQA